MEFKRLKKDPVNSRAVFWRCGGITYCYGYGCPYRKKHLIDVFYDVAKFKIHMSDKEEKYVKELGIPFLLDEDWVDKHSFYPSDVDGGYYGETALPIKSRDNIEEGDVIVFFAYDEWEDNGKFRTDRFYIVLEEDIKQYKRGERDLLPYGIIVKNPKNIKGG